MTMEITAPRATLTVEAVMALLEGSLAYARELGKPVYVAVMDSSARLVGLVGSEAAPRICSAVAQQKAFTSVAMGMPSAAFKAMLDAVPDEREIFLGQDGYIAAAGGLPVVVDGLVVGAVGVSGAGQGEDAACAQAGLASILPTTASS
jgi:glc operon protein GlcG